VARRQRGDARRDSLVRVAARHRANASGVALDDASSGGDRALDELAHALVAAARVDVDLEHRRRRRLQAHRHGVESEQDTVGHARW
jgi:hypothetical protein